MRTPLTGILLAAALLLGTVLPARALDIHIDNSQELGGSLVLRYQRPDGVWLTRGWLNFGPKSRQSIHVDTWNPVFYIYVEFGSGTSVQLSGETERFWIVRDVFQLEGDARPRNGRQVDFVRLRAGGDEPTFTLRF